MSARFGFGVFAVNSFIAAMLALFIAFSIGLPRPYWAMMTVYITAQPLTGALRSKAAYRVLGTSVGGAAAVVILPTFVDTPIVMSLVMAGWTGFCLYLSLLDRTPRAYVFMLAGYTTAVIGFPSVAQPDAIFETALARVEEITIGITCATLVHTVILPRDVGRTLTLKIQRFLQDAETWIGDALLGRREPAEREERRRLAGDVTELRVMASHLPFDTANLPLRVTTVQTLQARLAYVLPLISAIEDRLSQLADPEADVRRLIGDVVAWAEEKAAFAPRTDADHLIGRCEAMIAKIEASPTTWRTLLATSLLVRVQDLIQTLQDCRDLARLSSEGSGAMTARLRRLLEARPRPKLHLDPGMAALSGVALVVAVLTCCALWILLAWPEGAVAATMAAVFCSFFAAQDDPVPAIAGFLTWSTIALPLVALYLFAILPAVDGFAMLALSLAPPLIAIGFVQANPKWTGQAIGLLIGFLGLVGLQARYAASLPDVLNGFLAQSIGLAVALTATRLLRSIGARQAAERILRRSWKDIAGLARRPGGGDAIGWIGVMLDRVGLVGARIALTPADPWVEQNDALADMRVGLNVIDLIKVKTALSRPARRSLQDALDGIAQTYDAKAARRAQPARSAVLAAVDQTLSELGLEPPSPTRARGVAALVGLRRNLFPAAPAYLPPEAAAA